MMKFKLHQGFTVGGGESVYVDPLTIVFVKEFENKNYVDVHATLEVFTVKLEKPIKEFIDDINNAKYHAKRVFVEQEMV